MCRITGVQPFGFFATVVDFGGDGLVPVSTIGDEYFRYDEKAQQLVGEDSGTTYRTGQKLKLRIAEADPVSGSLRFELPELQQGERRAARAPRPRPHRLAAAGRPTSATSRGGADRRRNLSRARRIEVAKRERAMAYKIAIIVGSLRKDSINRKVARSICAIRGDNLDCSMIEIGDLPLYNQDYDALSEQPEAYVRFRDEVSSADGVLFVQPGI